MSGKSHCSQNFYSHGIVCRYCVVRKYSAVGSAVRTVHVGTLIEIHDIQKHDVLFCIEKNNAQDNDLFLCKRGDILFVPENLWGPLLAVDDHKRLPIIQDNELAVALGNISIGSAVKVFESENKDICVGTVTFKNCIAKLGRGVYFGLKIKYPNDNIEQIKANISLIEPGTKGFPRGCDIVVSIDKLRPFNVEKGTEKLFKVEDQQLFTNERNDDENLACESKSVSDAKDKNGSNLKSSHCGNSFDSNLLDLESQKRHVYDIPLSVNDEVVFLNGNIPEKGCVKWLGFINNSLKVGIEFENPIGSGTGTVNGVELFKTKYLHAAIMPPESLIKLSDFKMNTSKEFNNQQNPTNNNNYNNVRVTNAPSRNWTKDGRNEVKKNKIHNSDCPLRNPEYVGTSDENVREAGSGCSCSCNTECSECLSDTDYPRGSSNMIKQNRRFCNTEKVNFKDNDIPQDKEFFGNSKIPLVSVGTSPSQEFIEYFTHDWKDGSGGVGNNAYNKDLNVGDFDLNSSASGNLASGSQCDDKNNTHSNETQIWESHNPEPSTSEESDEYYDAPKQIFDHLSPEKLGEGSVVEFLYKEQPFYGIIRWIGTIPNDEEPHPRLIAGIEMEEESHSFTDGTFLDRRYFHCKPNRALFIPLSECRNDSRFLEEVRKPKARTINNNNSFGELNCSVIEGNVPPINQKFNVEFICGKNRGIQGHHNSCYLDATLFSMFAFTSVFDSLLFRPPNMGDIPKYREVQRVLKEEIVNPLRKNLYVRADQVMKLRTLLENLSSVSGLTCEEKDPEEFLHSLLTQILKAEPFLKLNSGQEAFHYQLFVEKDKKLLFPSVQQLFEQSFVASHLKLIQIPSCLIIQMPRFGKSFKMYSRIFPSKLLDITDILENSPRQCTVCGKLAEYECRECFGQSGIGNGLESTSFCKKCLDTAHNHHSRIRHTQREISVPFEFYDLQEHCTIPRIYMELFAVVCIETSHYVCFVKCGTGIDAPWCFFDSMADRKGEQNGYNIPEMVPCPDLPYWLSEEGAKALKQMKDERQLPELAKRLLCDAHICMYQSLDVMMYR